MIKHEFITLHGRTCVISYNQLLDQTQGIDIHDKESRVFMTQDGPMYYHEDKYHKKMIDYAHIVFVMITKSQMEFQLGLVQHGLQDN